jgi:hypothetical protein
MLSLIAPVVTLLAAPATDADVELYDYTVKKGDSCASIAKRVFGNRKAYDRIHKHNPGMGPTPHKLVPGTVLKLPREKSKPDAQVTATERQVEARSPSDTGWKTAGQGFDLFRGWRVSTLERAFAEVTFRDSSRIYMRENTLVIIYGGTEGSARRTSTTAKLDKGALRSRLGELSGGKALTVETPSSNTELEGGSALITVDEEGTSRVANHGGGKAKVRSGKSGKAVNVPERMGSKVRKGKAPTPPKPLPDTPTWLADNASTYIIPAGAAGTIHGTWKKVDKAETYRVAVGRMAQGGFVMSSVTVPKNATRFEVHGLQPGEYFATVAAIDDDAFESPPSRLYETNVITAPLTAPTGDAVAVPPAEAGKPMPPLKVLPGARLDVPSGVSCGLGDAAPADHVIATGAGVQEVRCQDASGKPVGGFSLDVATIAVGKADDTSVTRFAVRRDELTTLDLALSTEVELPDNLSVRAPDGFDVGAMTKDDAGGWSVPVTATGKAPQSATFDIVITGTDAKLTEFPVAVVEPGEPLEAPPEETPAPKRDTHMVELGVYGGFIAMSTTHELVTTDSPLANNRRINPIAPDVGVRFGYYPLRTFGVEVEGGLMPTALREGSDVLLFEGRASLIGQLPGRVTPYVLVGGGVTGLTSDADVLGDDTDASFHWGGGVKFFATKNLAIRLGVRDVVLTRSARKGSSHSPQVLLGISGVLRRTSAGKKK